MKTNRHESHDERVFRWRGLRDAEVRLSRTGYDGASITSYRFLRRSDQPERPDFVLVHGIGVSSRAFGPTALMLAEKGDVHLVDLPGYGRSPKPDRNLTIDDHADLVARYLEEKQLDHPVLVGHSMGSQVVASLAARYPELVDRVVLVAPVMTPDARRILPAVGRFLKDALGEPPTMALVAMIDYLFRSGLPYSIAQTPHLLHEPIEDSVAKVEADTLVISGTKDTVSPPRWGRHLASLMPWGRSATVPGPHGAMWVTPRALAELIDGHAEQK